MQTQLDSISAALDGSEDYSPEDAQFPRGSWIRLRTLGIPAEVLGVARNSSLHVRIHNRSIIRELGTSVLGWMPRSQVMTEDEMAEFEAQLYERRWMVVEEVGQRVLYTYSTVRACTDAVCSHT